MKDQYCPNCVIKLKANRKLLGGLTRWMVCPECGYRERPGVEQTEKVDSFVKRMKNRNKNKTQFNIESNG